LGLSSESKFAPFTVEKLLRHQTGLAEDQN